MENLCEIFQYSVIKIPKYHESLLNTNAINTCANSKISASGQQQLFDRQRSLIILWINGYRISVEQAFFALENELKWALYLSIKDIVPPIKNRSRIPSSLTVALYTILEAIQAPFKWQLRGDQQM